MSSAYAMNGVSPEKIKSTAQHAAKYFANIHELLDRNQNMYAGFVFSAT